MPIFDPESWKRLLHGDQSTWEDFGGHHALQHIQFDKALRALGGPAYPVLPLGSPTRTTFLGDPLEDEDDPEQARLVRLYPDAAWHDAHQMSHDGAYGSLLLGVAPDFRSYDLVDPDQFASWSFLHAADHVLLRQAIGL